MMSESTPKSGRVVLRRRDLFPIGQYYGRAVFVGVEDGVPYLLSAERSFSGPHAASIGAWAGAFVLSPVLSLVASALLGGEPTLGTLLLVVGLAALPVAAVIEFGAVRQSLELERSEIETRALLDLLVRSRPQGQILALLAPAHFVLFIVLAVFAASTARVDHLIGAAFALGLAPMSVYAARAAHHRHQWGRRWSQTLRST